jgi:hypothetical protein
MLSPDAPTLQAMLSVRSQAYVDTHNEGLMWPNYLQSNQNTIISHIGTLSDINRETLWRLFRAAIASKKSIYYTNTQGDCGLRIGKRSQDMHVAEAVWFIIRFPVNAVAMIERCPGHTKFANNQINEAPLFDNGGPVHFASNWIADLAPPVRNVPAIQSLMNDSPFNERGFPWAAVAPFLPIAHPVGGFENTIRAAAYRKNWLEGFVGN